MKKENKQTKINDIDISTPVKAILFKGTDLSCNEITNLTNGSESGTVLWNVPKHTGGIINTVDGLKDFKPGEYVCLLVGNKYKIMSKVAFEAAYTVSN